MKKTMRKPVQQTKRRLLEDMTWLATRSDVVKVLDLLESLPPWLHDGVRRRHQTLLKASLARLIRADHPLAEALYVAVIQGFRICRYQSEQLFHWARPIGRSVRVGDLLTVSHALRVLLNVGRYRHRWGLIRALTKIIAELSPQAYCRVTTVVDPSDKE